MSSKAKKCKATSNPRHSGQRAAGLLAVVIISLAVNSIGLDWGRTGLVSWEPDSIEGALTVHEARHIFSRWTHKYPRGHFIINFIFYKPFLDYWEKHPVILKLPNGRITSQSLTIQRLAVLAKISRIISVAMGTGTVLAVFFISMLLFKDYLAAVLAALTLALSQLFIFFSHTSNVDVPSIFWFTWGLYWAVKAAYIGKWHHFVLLGLFCGYSVCTKEPTGACIVGLGIATWIAMIHNCLQTGQSTKEGFLSIFSLKVLAAILVFTLCFVVLEGFLGGPEEFCNRMGFWGGVPQRCNADYAGQLNLLKQAAQNLYFGLGWPLLITCAISVVYCCIKQRWYIAFAVAPLITFYLLIITNIRFTCPRYLLPGYPGLALLVGKTFAQWLRWKKVADLLRILPIGFVYALSLIYCIGLDLEMLSDTRVRTEQWFYKNVTTNNVVGVGIYNKVYAPRLRFNGYNVICPWRASDIQGTNEHHEPYPDYLIMAPDWPRIDEPNENIFREKLFNGQLNYEKAASFTVKYLYPARTIFGFPGWLTPKQQFVSPEMVIFKKIKDSGKFSETPVTNLKK